MPSAPHQMPPLSRTHMSQPRLTIAVTLILSLLGPIGPGCVAPAAAQGNALTTEQTQAQAAYDKALRAFKAILAERRAQMDGGRELPERPGQALYLARLATMSTYKDLTDAMPSRI